ncbi:LacI family DNA-binding transcriptional regulator [Propioniciclava soli]|uniref:LacI family DNA-binding transcriptional regulator n=1 Tax=Propioniciclava soli TaxID=2775081 RepID=A0ABZ3C412_9ACTN|nr:LacI family DNA-binding transcriptional regulator [Propioniciclava soli]
MGRRTPGSAPTLSDVAQHAGVSLATASRAINGSQTRVVGEELRERVLASARALGYAPDANAQAMARGTTRAVGVIVHDLTDPYFAAVADAMSRAATERDLFLTLATTGNHVEHLAEVVAQLDTLRVRAIVLVGGRWKANQPTADLLSAVDRYVSRGGRVVTIGMEVPGVDSVNVDSEDGARQLARHLHRLGYRSPLILSGPELHSTAVTRSAAFVRALADEGIAVHPDHLISSDFTRTGGAIAMRMALEAGVDVDVAIAMNDVMALGAMAEARANGVAVPQELAFTGFGDIPSLQDVIPSLTTVHIPSSSLATLALNLALDGPGDGTGDVTVPVMLVARDSTPERAG